MTLIEKKTIVGQGSLITHEKINQKRHKKKYGQTLPESHHKAVSEYKKKP